MEKRYDVFCSYCRIDNDSGWVDSLIDNVTSMYRKFTGEPLKVFFDKHSIVTSEIWEKKIRISVERSKLLLAVLSPSYFKSEWCVEEWRLISNTEDKLASQGKLPEQCGLIVPILLHPLDRGKFSGSEKQLIADARRRQWQDFTSASLEMPIRPTQVKALVEDIIDKVYELDSLATPAERPSVGTLVIDTKTNLMWSGVLSPSALTFEEAKAYLKEFDLGDYHDWRLPIKKEIETLVDPTLVDPDKTTYPLYAPFNAQRWGYLHTGTMVPPPYGKGSNYIMNLRNGHIFNGLGYKAFVRPVRSP